jgi:hypothetical protein
MPGVQNPHLQSFVNKLHNSPDGHVDLLRAMQLRHPFLQRMRILGIPDSFNGNDMLAHHCFHQPLISINCTRPQVPPINGNKQALTARCFTFPFRSALVSSVCITTVQAPHPPSPQPSFVPLRPCCERMKSRSVHCGLGTESCIRVPFK